MAGVGAGVGAAALLGPLVAEVEASLAGGAVFTPALFLGQARSSPPTLPNWIKSENAPPEARRLRQSLSREALLAASGRTRRWFAGQKMDRAVTDPLGIQVQAYRSYKSQPGHPYDEFLGVERFWSYDMGVVLCYLVRRGELEEAQWLADRMMEIADQMKANDEKGGWRFSHGDTFTDARSMSGGTAYVFKGLYAVALQTGDAAFLERVTEKFKEIAFEQQVMDAKDPRYGHFRAGFGTGDEYGISNDQREESTIERNWDYIDALRLAYRAHAQVDPSDPILNQLAQRHDLAIRMTEDKLLLTPEKVRAQMRRLEREWRLTEKLRRQHDKVAAEIEKLPGKRRWGTGMNVTVDENGKVETWDVNLSWAWDNEGWSPHGAYDEDLAYDELRNLEARFVKEIRAGEFSHLPKGADPEERFIGLIFFTGDFADLHVPANPDFERMLEPEATWGCIFRLIQFGYHTADAERRQWAYGLDNIKMNEPANLR